MNKRDMMRALSERLDIPQLECKTFLDCLSELIAERLRQEGSVKLTGIGRLYTYKQSTRPGRNPRTGVPCAIPERLSAKLRPSKCLLHELNEK